MLHKIFTQSNISFDNPKNNIKNLFKKASVMFPGNLNPVAFRVNSLLCLVHVIIFHDCYAIDHQVAP